MPHSALSLPAPGQEGCSPVEVSTKIDTLSSEATEDGEVRLTYIKWSVTISYFSPFFFPTSL